MATKLCCDGCGCDLTPAEAQTVGRYDPCVYCPDCLTKWRAFEAAQRATHAQIVTSFETWRANALAALKIAGNVGALARVPDEG